MDLTSQGLKSQVPLKVVVDLPQHSGLRHALSYSHTRPLPAGTLVQVPLGRREVLGVVWDDAPTEATDTPSNPVAHTVAASSASDREPPGELRAVTEVFQDLPALSPQWRRLIEFTADYYQRSVGEVALSVLPPELRKASAAALAKRCARLAKPVREGDEKSAADADPLAPLTPEQALALEQLGALHGSEPGATLLHGVTGSGKTEVYLRLAAQALAQGRQVLVMVPEINLTPQLEQRLRQRFSAHVLVAQHSALSPVQRLNHWLQAHLGQADLLLGTRMSVMASLPRLGLIIVDEEHDPSYKQQEGARYSARDLAVYRGRLEGVPVLLGSATPALETWRHAQEGRYRRLVMAERVGGGVLPEVQLIDMNLEGGPTRGAQALSQRLIAAIQERIDRGEQSLLLLNRRGYAPVLHCSGCGWKSACAHCSAWQVFHKEDRSLRCHHCGAAQRVPRACPECGNLDLQPVGRGTERLEEQLPPLLRGRSEGPVRILRIDADTTRRAGSLQAQLAEVHEGEVDVLVGTQMVAKGHDFRRITLVAAVNPDGALFTSDFRAPERLFALLMQAAGRAGRDAAQASRSRMLVQTWHPAHPLYQALLRHDYEAFARSQLEERQAVGLPPFSHLALLRVEARELAVAMAFMREAGLAADEECQACGLGAEVVTRYPAVPATVARIAGQERLQLLLESSSRPALLLLLRRWSLRLQSLREAHRGISRWALDVDPLSL